MNAPASNPATANARAHGYFQRNPRAKTPPGRRNFTLGGIAQALGKTTLTVALVLLVAFLAVWYSTPYFLRDYLNKKGEGLPDYRLHINWVQINPLPCSLDIEDVTLVKMSDKIPVPFFSCPRVHVALQWRAILHGNLRSWIALTHPIVNFVQGPTDDTSQVVLEPAWVTQVKKMVPLSINRFTIDNGVIHFYDFHADPQIDLMMDQLNLSLDNLTNSNHSKELMPSTAYLTGRPFGIGVLEARFALNVDLKQPTFAEKVKLEKVPAPELNSFLAKYGSVYAKSGTIAFYTEMVSAKGSFNGYIKPFFQNLQFEPVPKDRNGLAALWASMVNGMKDLLENDDHAVATNVPISGNYSDPDINFWSAAFGLVKNAFFQALSHGFNHPEITPAPEKQEISQTAVDQAVDKNMPAGADKSVDVHQPATGPKSP
jgi:hypothetical protein